MIGTANVGIALRQIGIIFLKKFSIFQKISLKPKYLLNKEK